MQPNDKWRQCTTHDQAVYPPPAVFEVGIKDRIDDYGPLKDATSRVNSKVKAVRETLWTGVYCVMPTDKQYRTGTRVGFREARASHQQGVSHQTPQFLKPRNSIANPGLHNFCYQLCIVK